MAHGQLDRDLTAEGVPKHRHGRQVARFQPVGQVVGVLGDVEHPARITAEPEAWQIDHMDRVVAGQHGRQRHHVAVGDRQPMEQDHRRGAVGTAKRSAIMNVHPSDRPPAALEPSGRAGGAGRQPVPVKGATKSAANLGLRPQSLMAECH